MNIAAFICFLGLFAELVAIAERYHAPHLVSSAIAVVLALAFYIFSPVIADSIAVHFLPSTPSDEHR